MSRFQYVAVDVHGATDKRYIEAIDEVDARKKLLLANLDVQSIELKEPLLRRELKLKKQRIKPMEILHFTNQMAAFLGAGLSIIDGLDLIAKNTPNPSLAEMLQQMRDDVREGMPFEDALAEHQKVLPRYYVGVVRSASLTGRLDDALAQLGGYMERELEAKARVKSAMAYPMVIIGMSMVSVVILTVFVLPKFVDLFKSLGTELPFTTQLMINFANFSANFWWIYLLMIAGLFGFVQWMKRSPKGRYLRDSMLLKLPLVGDIAVYAAVERICRILSTLWQAGVPVADAMTAAVQSADNLVFEEKLVPVQEAVLAGEGLAEPLASVDLFPDAALQMIAVGEASGTLAEQLENAANFYGRELEYKLKRLTTYFEPAVIILVGLVVGFVAISLVQAMYGSLGGGVK
jgi:type IV pilus assembly protein PilC